MLRGEVRIFCLITPSVVVGVDPGFFLGSAASRVGGSRRIVSACFSNNIFIKAYASCSCSMHFAPVMMILPVLNGAIVIFLQAPIE